MNLPMRLAEYFSSNVRKRGDEYYASGQVRIMRGSDSEVIAKVRGAQVYKVELVCDADNTLAVWCDCPHCVDGFACKHIWATLRAADTAGHLAAAENAELVIDDGEFGLGDDDYELDSEISAAPQVPRTAIPTAPQAKPSTWRQQIKDIFNVDGPKPAPGLWPAKRELLYLVDVAPTLATHSLVLMLQIRERKKDGTFGKLKAFPPKRAEIHVLPAEDREIVSTLLGANTYHSYGYGGYGYGSSYGYAYGYDPGTSGFAMPHTLASVLLPRLIQTGRFFMAPKQPTDELRPLTWDGGDHWQFGLEMHRAENGAYELNGFFRRADERIDVAAPLLVTSGGFVVASDRISPLAPDAAFNWITNLRRMGRLTVPEGEQDEFLASLLCSPNLPPLELPEELRYEEDKVTPRPHLQISKPQFAGRDRLRAELAFDYDGRIVPVDDAAAGFFESRTRRLVRRDNATERRAAALLDELGVKLAGYWNAKSARELAPSKLPHIVRALVEAGWHIEAEGRIFRRAGSFRLDVASGVDWFELRGEVAYDSQTAPLPRLLEALRRKETMVRLDDGTYGLLPEEWLRRVSPLAGMGTPEDNSLRFRRSQAGLLDALLVAQPEASCDATFAHLREELQRFQRVEAAEQPEGFVGKLRNYQLEGLGWMHFLRRFGFGGCLADDMGVGKTAQVLALLETRRTSGADGEQPPPSLVVVPRSLVFNWKQEAARFTPQLRVLDYTGTARNGEDFEAYDLVITTYGTLRRDAWHLKDVAFDYVVLDEAQAVKNADTESSKAVRLLRGTHRLALSGTPVENHLGELWTLFEFLNPGMLGAASAFKLAGGTLLNPSEEIRQLLAHALRPFILRRTKEQVAQELPPKIEQTIYCEMEKPQSKLYDELRRHYRDSLLRRIETEGLAKSKIQVLEALLRLRQAACHPGLLDPQRTDEPSAKLETLLDQLREVLEEGHKALVFSQFTSLLKIVRDRLDVGGIPYEYLDGAVRDRQKRVERFQNDAGCKLFLISLKAGGLGLNLTAAEYVFILDPWWNPAVEAQAVDRAHRIGQTRQVFAYRLIARNTIEEKVLGLQNTKRDLAAAIISADNSLIRDLRAEDLEVLLS